MKKKWMNTNGNEHHGECTTTCECTTTWMNTTWWMDTTQMNNQHMNKKKMNEQKRKEHNDEWKNQMNEDIIWMNNTY